MKFTPQELLILEKFSNIDSRMGIYPDRFKVWSESVGAIASFKVESDYDFEPFGIYNMSEFLKVVSFFKDDYSLDFTEKTFLTLANNKYNINYCLSTLEPVKTSIPVVPLEAVESKYNSMITEKTIFNISWQELSEILNIKKTLNSKNIFIEVVEDKGEEKIKFTISEDPDKNEKNFSYSEYFIAEGIKNTDVKNTIKFELKDTSFLVKEDYVVEITPKITKWTSESGVVYYIFPSS